MRPRSPKLLVLTLAGVAAGCMGNIGGDPGEGVGGSGTGSTTGGTGSTSGGTGSTSGGTGSTSGGTGSTSGGTGSTGGSTTLPPGSARPIEFHGAPKYYRFVRLTHEQWASSVKELLRLTTVPAMASNFLPPVAGSTDFINNEHLLDITGRLWSDYESAAETLASQVTATDAALRSVYSGTQDAAMFIQTFGRRAFRRPLTTAEVSSYQTLFTSAATLSGSQSAFTKGAGLVIEAMLQSPHFLYRSEMGASGAALSGYEMAAKLSLLLRNSTPNDALLDAAAGSGRFETADGAAALATTMLGEPTATEAMRRLHGEMLDVQTFDTISKTGVPSYREALNDEYIETSYRFFDKLFTQNLGLRELLTSTTGFVGPGMAPLYGVAAPTSGYVERDLGPRRVGFFSQLPYLTRFAVNLEPHPIFRGVRINFDILCVDPGMPEVIPSIPALMPNQTNRERYAALTGGCGGECHNSFINPIGFAFENFDGMGQWRDMENGKPIDATGSYPLAEGVKTFTNSQDLMRTIAEGQQAHTCYSKKLAGFALQRDIAATDMPLLAAMKTASMAAGGSIKQVFLELVKNPAFRTRVGGAP